eukprot:scaffold1.g5882.t1
MAAVEVKLFGKWEFDTVEVNDISLEDYLAVKPKFARFTPHSAGRFQTRRFRKAQCPIVERLTNSLMMHGRNNGKKLMATQIVRHAFDIVNLLTDQNPIQVLVDAIINGGPREDATRIGSAGVVRRQAVDVSPLRRVNQAIWLITTGAREAAFRNIKTIAECLADELINAAKGSSNSYAIKKKDELERVAKANRLHVKVPALGESITDGTVAAVLKAPGDAVEEDEPIVQIETDKVTVDVRAPKAGTIEAILVKEEENVEVGHMVASIRERVAGIERPLGAAPQPGVGASTSAPAAPAAAPSGRRPSISFPPRRTPEGKVISALPAADAAAALAAFGAAPATAPPPPRVAPVATATGAAPSPRPAMQSQMRVTVLHGAPPPPRVSMTEHEMEVIMLGGAEP